MSKKEQMLSMVADYKASGLSGAAFCRDRGIHRSLLYYWIKRYDQQTSPGGFMELKPTHKTNKSIEVTYPNGVRVLVPVSELHLLQTLIKAY